MRSATAFSCNYFFSQAMLITPKDMVPNVSKNTVHRRDGCRPSIRRRPSKLVPIYRRSESFSIKHCILMDAVCSLVNLPCQFLEFLPVYRGKTIETLQAFSTFSHFSPRIKRSCFLPVPRPALIVVRCSPTDTEFYRVDSKTDRTCLQNEKHFLLIPLFFKFMQSFVLQKFANQSVTLSTYSDQLANTRDSTSLLCLFCGSSLCCCDEWSTT